MTEDDKKFLTTQMGKCWHEYDQLRGKCKHCKETMLSESYPAQTYTFTTWTDFGHCWEWAQKQEWWDDFHEYSVMKWDNADALGWYGNYIINPIRFQQVVCDFLRERKIKEVRGKYPQLTPSDELEHDCGEGMTDDDRKFLTDQFQTME